MLRDEILTRGSAYDRKMGGLPVVESFAALQKFLAGKGMELHTYDVYKNRRGIDYWLMLEPGRRKYLFMLQNLINPRRVLFLITEPAVTNHWAWEYMPFYLPLHKVFLATFSDLAEKYPDKFVEFKVPVPFPKEKYPYYLHKPKKNLCLLMQSNKLSRVKGELYTLRREIIRYFEKRGDRLLDLFGFGWNMEAPATNIFRIPGTTPFYTDLYQGVAPDKWETFAEYWFTFCVQNSIPAGDFEFDPFMAMATGTVPIYLPPPNADQYIPPKAYINYNDFGSLDGLVAYLQAIAGTEVYENYRQAGWQFINSERYRPFTVEKFCEDVYRAIQKL